MFSFFIVMSSLLADISPKSFFALEAMVRQPKTTVSVKFDEVNSLKIGSPVIVNGMIVGEVSKIIKEAESNNKETINVELNVSANISSSTIALQSTPTLASKNKPEAIVELLSLPISSITSKKTQEYIKGFSSFEKFWSAGI